MRPLRPFTILDLLVLVATVAAVIALDRFWQAELIADGPIILGSGYPLAAQTRFAAHAMSGLIPATLWLLVSRLRPPRPRIRRLVRQPGFAVGLVAFVAMVGQVVATPFHVETMGSFTSPMLMAAWYWPTTVGSAVFAQFVLLSLSQRWLSRGDWIDRLGMLVGIGWVGLTPGLLAVGYLL